MSMFHDVRKMHERFGFKHPDCPQPLTYQELVARHGMMHEELDEFLTAMAANDLAGQADALVDLVVFALGTAVMLGLPWQELWDDVLRANLAKERGIGPRGVTDDLIKPPGWQGPQTKKILEAARSQPPARTTDRTRG